MGCNAAADGNKAGIGTISHILSAVSSHFNAPLNIGNAELLGRHGIAQAHGNLRFTGSLHIRTEGIKAHFRHTGVFDAQQRTVSTVFIGEEDQPVNTVVHVNRTSAGSGKGNLLIETEKIPVDRRLLGYTVGYIARLRRVCFLHTYTGRYSNNLRGRRFRTAPVSSRTALFHLDIEQVQNVLAVDRSEKVHITRSTVPDIGAVHGNRNAGTLAGNVDCFAFFIAAKRQLDIYIIQCTNISREGIHALFTDIQITDAQESIAGVLGIDSA